MIKRLINKSNKEIVYSSLFNMSRKNGKKWCILSDSIVFPTEEDVEIFPKPYTIESLVTSTGKKKFKLCTEIIYKSDEEIAEIEEQMTRKKRKVKFGSDNVKLVVNYDYAFANYKDLMMYCKFRDDIRSGTHKKKNGELVITATILLEQIKQSHYDLIKNDDNFTISTKTDPNGADIGLYAI